MLTKENGFDLRIQWQFPEARKYAFTFISLFIVLIIAYSNSFYGDWHFDDFANIVENPHVQIKSLSWSEMKHCVTGIYQDRLLRPLSYLSFALNYQFDGLNVFGFHVVNFIIHYLCAVFLFLFIYNTLKLPRLKDQFETIAYPVALLASFFWAIHPLFVTSVSYIVQRMTSMAGMFYILSMYLYLKGRTSEKTGNAIIFFGVSALSGLASILTKENAITLPVSIFLFDLLLIQGVTKKTIIKFGKILIFPLLLIVIIGFLYTGGLSSAFDGYAVRDFTMGERLLTEPRVILFYLSLLFYPIHSRLTLLYDIDVSTSFFSPWTTLPSIFLILLMIGVAIYLAKRRPLISFCLLFFFLNHLIEGTVLPLELIYEHRNYLPAMLLFVPVAHFIVFVIDYFSYTKIIQSIVALSVIIIIFGLGDITFRRNMIVADEFLLWTDNIEKYPELSRPYTNLGLYYLKRDEKEAGLFNFNQSLKLNKFANSQVRNFQFQNLGIYYFKAGEYDAALKYFEIAVRNMPSDVINKIHISYIYLSKNEYSRAHDLIHPLLSQQPGNLKLNETYCLILLKEHKLEEAEGYAKKILNKNLNRTFPLIILAEAARKKGNNHSALFYWKLYQLSSPLDPYCNLALIELYDQIDAKEKLNEELSKLFCFKRNSSLRSYLNEVSRNPGLLVYVPDPQKITQIVNRADILNK